MKLKNKSAFPVLEHQTTRGMTYREWLIGQIASNAYESVNAGREILYVAKDIIELADELIKQLEEDE